MAYELIETIELTSSAASIEFTSIPQDGTDLVLKVTSRNTSTSTLSRFRINNDTTSSYTPLILRGNGSTVTSSSFAPLNNPFAFEQTISTDTANTFGNGQMYFSNYTSTTNKSISHDTVGENNGTTAWQTLIATSYTTTNPITSIQLFQTSGDFATGTTASLYKITAA